jgi:nucleotide-binding universal stress UspA family protein
MHKLLVAVDGSESALRAVRYAMKLARENGPCSIHLVNVHEPPLLYGELAVYVPREKMERLQREHSEALLEPAAAILREGSVPFTTETLVGEVAATIARRADELGCDAIVMGTRGMGAIGNLVMGSVATKVVHLAKVPVTLVK